MSIANVSSSPSASASKANGFVQSPQEIQDRFLKLLVAQLKNQDPLEPTDNAQITSQMAQLNTVSGIQGLNDQLKLLTGMTAERSVLDSADLAGRSVLVSADRTNYDKGDVLRGAFELKSPADDVNVTVRNTAGQVVFTQNLGSHPSGLHSFQWDGTLPNGSEAATGPYRVEVSAKNGEQTTRVGTLLATKVDSVENVDNNVRLNLAGGTSVALSEVRRFF